MKLLYQGTAHLFGVSIQSLDRNRDTVYRRPRGGVRMKKSFFCIVVLMLMVSFSMAADDPLDKLKDQTLQFFKSVSGKITRVEESTITFEIDSKELLRPGMRLNILREGEPFRHPVTREILGRVETHAGKVEVRDIQGGLVTGALVEGTAKEGDRVRISETKVKMVFVQEKKVDWYLGDDLYRKLKNSGRVAMVDTGLESGDEKSVIEEAKKLGVDVALLLTAQEADKGTLLRERLFWVPDGAKFLDAEVKVDIAFTKDLRFGSEFFAPLSGEAVFRYSLPYGGRFVVTGDFDGDGKQEIAISTGKDIRTYLPAVDLQPLWELKDVGRGEQVWLDTMDLNGNGRDELIITLIAGRMTDNKSGESLVSDIQPGDVVSLVYELSGSEFRRISAMGCFLRKAGTSLIGQMYSSSDGFKDDVFTVVWKNGYQRGEKVKLPRGITIYDYMEVEGPDKERALFTYDEKGYLNIFNDKGIRIWRSGSDTGGFITTFKKPAPASYVEAGEWSIKDRLLTRGKEVLVVKRIPVVNMSKGIGYKSSQIKSYWWNGFSMDERTLVENVPGTLLDYALAGDKVVVLASPLFGIKFENILKGENPLGASLHIYSVSGR